jgi:hypothetical protein
MMKKAVLFVSFVVLNIFVARDASACVGCCWPPPGITKCCSTICGTTKCEIQSLGGAPWCVRSGEFCSDNDAWCQGGERHVEEIWVRCNSPRPTQYTLVSVKIKHRAA